MVSTVHEFRVKVPVFGPGDPTFVWCIATEYGKDEAECIPLLDERFPDAYQILPKAYSGKELVLAELKIPQGLQTTAGSVICAVCHPHHNSDTVHTWCTACGQWAVDHPVREGTPQGVRAHEWFRMAEREMGGFD